MRSIPIVGASGQPILFASLEKGRLVLSFEYYGKGEGEDYEIIFTVSPEEFPAIAAKFELEPVQDILALITKISSLGFGEDLYDALKSKEIKNEFFSWYS